MSGISFQPVRIDGHDAEGSFLLHDGQLLAVVARLDCESVAPEFKGRWHLEAGFWPLRGGRDEIIREPRRSGTMGFWPCADELAPAKS